MTPLLGRHFRFEGLVRHGGEAGGPGAAHRVLGRRVSGDPDGAGLIPFVGREREMDMLLDLAARAEAGRGQVVGIVGEPGIGKSRLLRELRRRLGGRGVTVREGRCLPGGRATVASTVAEIMRQDYGIDEGADEATIARKVREGVAGMGLSPEEWAPSLLLVLGVREGTGGLLALPAEARKTRVFSALRRLAVERSRREPFVLALDDVHWIGKTSEEFLQFLVRSLPASRIVLLCTYRPEYRPPWLAASCATQLALPPLERAESRASRARTTASSRSPTLTSATTRVRAPPRGGPWVRRRAAATSRSSAGRSSPRRWPTGGWGSSARPWSRRGTPCGA
ncbi:MAG: AAA family ATPase [Candidatus Rokubacteria bacterium]|nr:AAA family ATPase [Candidatus Rokubacteria bacterium]